jgi:hypothetical protein
MMNMKMQTVHRRGVGRQDAASGYISLVNFHNLAVLNKELGMVYDNVTVGKLNKPNI